MKKIISLFTTISIVFGVLGTFTVFAQVSVPNRHNVNAYVTRRSINGNWGDSPVKAFSRQELDDCLTTIFGEYAPQFEQYDEEFFKDKFVSLVFLTAGNWKWIDITSISEGTNKIVIETALTSVANTEAYYESYVVVEADKSLSDRDIVVSLKDLREYGITYYEGAVNDMQLEGYTPCTKVITSSSALENCTDNAEFLAKYNNLDFDEYCLLLVAWNEPRQVRTRSIANVEYVKFDYDNQYTNYRITLSETEPGEEYPEVVTPYFAVVKMSKYRQYDNFDIQIKNMYSTNDYIYEINNVDDLVKFRDTVNSGYNYENTIVTLNTDIDLSSVCGENVNGEKISWTPIGDIGGEPYFCNGDMTHQFDGTFDGRGHKITNLYINAYIEDEDAYEEHAETLGLFGFVQGTIRNLAVEGSVTAPGYASGIIGCAEDSNIEKCSFTGTINSVAHSGGIVGTIRGGSISDCFNAADITGFGGIGGITGVLDRADMERCYNTGNIIPMNEHAKYLGSIATVGNETVTDCYYLEGTSDKGLYIESYGEEEEGTDTTTALTLEQFADKTNFTNWDFDTVWEMDENLGRPVLRSNKEYDYSIRYENEKAVVTVPQSGTYTVIFAAYDDNGRLSSVNAQDIQLVKGENTVTPQNFTASGKVKAMLWESLSGMKPLAK